MIRTDTNSIGKDKFSLAILLFALIFILIATLFPFTFHIKEFTRFSILRFQFVWFKSASDFLKNIFLFFPLGFGLGGLVEKKSNNQLFNWTFVLAFGLCLSTTVEGLQVLLPSRFPSSSDIIANLTGTGIGLVIFKNLGLKFINFASRVVRELKGYFRPRNLCIFLVIYVFFALYITRELNRGLSLENWDESFYLLVGNEKTEDRPWQGKVFNFEIFDHALSKKEIEKIFYRNSAIDPGYHSLLCYYEPDKERAYRDKTGLNPDLIWKAKIPEDDAKIGQLILQDHWLETESPVTQMINKIKGESKFTLAATVATADTFQSGPARIITISKDPYNRNLTLGQEGSDLIFRLRTPLTGENGISPELVAPNVFGDKKPHDLIITYNGKSLSLFVDGKSNPSSLALSSGAVLWNYFFKTNVEDLFGYRALYDLILLFPVLLLVLPLFISHDN